MNEETKCMSMARARIEGQESHDFGDLIRREEGEWGRSFVHAVWCSIDGSPAYCEPFVRVERNAAHDDVSCKDLTVGTVASASRQQASMASLRVVPHTMTVGRLTGHQSAPTRGVESWEECHLGV